MTTKKMRQTASSSPFGARTAERGVALVTALLILVLLMVISMSVLAVVTTESRIAGSDLCRTQAFYGAASGIEKMTSDFSALFARSSRPPSQAQLNTIRNAFPSELTAEGFAFNQTLTRDNATLNAMQTAQGITNGSLPRVTIQNGSFAGLNATIDPYLLSSIATQNNCGAQVNLQREINNYLIPLFQFGMFSNEDIELHPGPAFVFNGRVHANGNIYVSGNVRFLAKVTTANEFVRDLLRNGSPKDSSVSMQVGAINVPMTVGSVNNGPNLPGATSGTRGYFPGSPAGTANSNWESTSVAAPRTGVANQFGGQLQTRTTGGVPLLLPLQVDGNPTREIIKRRMPNDSQTLSESRYHSKAQIRILIDDEGVANDASGIPAASGVNLSTFTPTQLPAVAPSTAVTGGGRALWRINDNGTYQDTAATAAQQQTSGTSPYADTVRGVRSVQSTSPYGAVIPAGAGIAGHILIQVVDSNGNIFDVTQQVLSMGVTEGEPNAIVQLQRPLWAAFTQGSRDASGNNNNLTYILNSTTFGRDGQIKTTAAKPAMDVAYGYLTTIEDDSGVRSDAPPVLTAADLTATSPLGWSNVSKWKSIVPINVYNVREGYINTSLDNNTVYERGITSVVEVNMRNLARWVDGVYDTNLLAGTNAISARINGSEGYILYVSDRRGDNVKQERDTSGATINTTNGMDDNEDIYGWASSLLNPGEDVIDAGTDLSTGQPKRGTIQKDTAELPNPAALAGAAGTNRFGRAVTVAAWNNPSIFRRAVRLFNAENLQVTGAAGKLSTTKGISVASENMVYIWGNYNTTGINVVPAGGATLSNGYTGPQVPASIVADAFFPLSKTWFDASSSTYPDDITKRLADNNLPGMSSETSMRAGIIAGNNLSALAGTPDAGNGTESRLNGGMHNFPRFLEDWNSQRWNFLGALIPLYHSTQAVGPYDSGNPIYSPPTRNWAFDDSFTDPNRLPPGTPSFQYIEPTGFRQVL